MFWDRRNDRGRTLISSIYPNPASMLLNLVLTSDASVSLYDMNGKVVYTAILENGNHVINADQLDPRCIYADCRNGNITSRMRIIKHGNVQDVIWNAFRMARIIFPNLTIWTGLEFSWNHNDFKAKWVVNAGHELTQNTTLHFCVSHTERIQALPCDWWYIKGRITAAQETSRKYRFCRWQLSLRLMRRCLHTNNDLYLKAPSSHAGYVEAENRHKTIVENG